MESKTIKVTSVRENEYGIQIGYKPDDGDWQNYFVNDEALFGYFTKGATLVVEYTTSRSGAKVVKGVSTATPAVGAATDTSKNKSIEKQTVAKCAAGMFAAGSDMPTAFEFAAWVNSAWRELFGTPDAEQVFTEGESD